MSIRSLIFSAFLCVSIFIATPAFAQFDLNSIDFSDLGGASDSFMNSVPSFGELSPGVDALFVNLALIPRPSHPGPFEEFEVELTAPGAKYSGARIIWLVNGQEMLSARDSRKQTFTTGALGETMNIEAQLNLRNGTTEVTTLTIEPNQVDIILEGLTSVPFFYKGRALPTRQSEARAIAIVNSANSIDRDSLSYEWKLNGVPISAGSIRGLMGINFTMPLDREIYLGVTITDVNGVVGRKTIILPVAEPEILFYEENPLRGILGNAFTDTYDVRGNQVVVRAEPYYMTPFLNNSDFLIDWKLNSRSIENGGAAEPNVITLRGSGSQSRASVSFQIINRSTLGQALGNSFRLEFGN